MTQADFIKVTNMLLQHEHPYLVFAEKLMGQPDFFHKDPGCLVKKANVPAYIHMPHCIKMGFVNRDLVKNGQRFKLR